MTTALHPERILRDLNEQWALIGKEQAGSGGVLRACAMTLLVAARDDADADRARQTLALLVHDHPSRAIVIRGRGHGILDARVFAECWRPMGRAQQICSEGIEILPGPGGMEETARFLVPLLAPDLPVVLWVRGSAPDGALGAQALYPLAGKLLFDTSAESDADAALRGLRRLHAYGYHVADLHWTRLTGWREAIAHLFDDGARADRVRSVHVSYGRGPVTTCARYLEAWLRSSLPLARVSIAPEYAEPGLHSVIFTGPGGELSVTRHGHALEIAAPDRHYITALPPSDEAALMQEELGILGPDPVYERTLNA
jgi:glucose-6-phosphate dehydrogenase assembly protein OpcA